MSKVSTRSITFGELVRYADGEEMPYRDYQFARGRGFIGRKDSFAGLESGALETTGGVNIVTTGGQRILVAGSG